jgi:hypothetical protein
VLASTVVTHTLLYPLYCTLYFCTLTRRQPTAPVALSSTFVSDFLLKILHFPLNWLQLSQHFFCLWFRLEISSFPKTHIFLLEVSRELPQRSTLNSFFIALSFLVVHLHSLTLFALTFLCVTFQPVDFCSVPKLPHLRHFVHSFALQWLPIVILRRTSAQQTFGLCQLFLTLQT